MAEYGSWLDRQPLADRVAQVVLKGHHLALVDPLFDDPLASFLLFGIVSGGRDDGINPGLQIRDRITDRNCRRNLLVQLSTHRQAASVDFLPGSVLQFSFRKSDGLYIGTDRRQAEIDAAKQLISKMLRYRF